MSREPPFREQPTVRWLPYVVLALALLLTAVTSYHALTTAEARDRLRFQNLVEKLRPIIQNRMEIYIALLRATAGLFAAEPDVDGVQFHDFVARVKLRELYAGVQGIGFSRRIATEELDSVVASMRRQGQPGFHIWPEGSRSELHSILYLEPLDRRNQTAIGYDMSTEPVRRAAMERARDSGTTAFSERVTLAGEPGFLIYTPVYRRDAPIADEAERRAALAGYTFSPFRAETLFHSILGPDTDQTVSFEVFGGPAPAPESRLYRSHNADDSTAPAFTQLSKLDLANSTWTLRFASLPGFAAASNRDQAILHLLLGLFTSTILFLVTRSEVRARSAAERVAADLLRSQEELRAEHERYRRVAAAEHQARDEAETANQAKDRFLATLSHELRTPLAPVLAVISNLEAKSDLAAGLREGLGVIRRNVELEARLIDDLLDLTRIAQNKLELKTEIADLRSILDHALDACCPPSTSQSGRFFIEAAPGGPGDYRLWADAARLTQVFWNLFKNALKFSHGDSPVHVRARRVETDESSARLVVEVADSGIGIEPGRLGRVFDAFEQGQRTITRRYGGLGLGLAISKSIVELHGGRLTASSDGNGRGATFTVELPVGSPQAWPAAAAEPASAGTAGAESVALHILLVEDHADTADAMATLLTILGHSVTVAGNAEQAIEATASAAAESRDIDLIISDVGLPDRSGLELMADLRRSYGFPGIALSGYGMDEDVEKSLKAGFSLHVTKPVSLPHLKAAIAMVMSGEAAARKLRQGKEGDDGPRSAA